MNRLIDASRPDTVPCQPDIIHHIHKAFRLCLPGTQACTCLLYTSRLPAATGAGRRQYQHRRSAFHLSPHGSDRNGHSAGYDYISFHAKIFCKRYCHRRCKGLSKRLNSPVPSQLRKNHKRESPCGTECPGLSLFYHSGKVTVLIWGATPAVSSFPLYVSSQESFQQ